MAASTLLRDVVARQLAAAAKALVTLLHEGDNFAWVQVVSLCFCQRTGISHACQSPAGKSIGCGGRQNCENSATVTMVLFGLSSIPVVHDDSFWQRFARSRKRSTLSGGATCPAYFMSSNVCTSSLSISSMRTKPRIRGYSKSTFT